GQHRFRLPLTVPGFHLRRNVLPGHHLIAALPHLWGSTGRRPGMGLVDSFTSPPRREVGRSPWMGLVDSFTSPPRREVGRRPGMGLVDSFTSPPRGEVARRAGGEPGGGGRTFHWRGAAIFKLA